MRDLTSGVLTTAKPGSMEYEKAVAGKITASMASAILCPGEPGVYGTPFDTWMKIKQRIEDAAEEEEEEEGFDDEPEDDDMLAEESPRAELEWGLETENLHRALLNRHAGLTVAPLDGTYQDETLPWLAATPDGMVQAEGMEIGTLELKAPTKYGVNKWIGGAPRGVIVQAQVQMRVMKAQWGVVSALIPPKPQWERVYSSPEWEEWILSGLTAFWENHVMADVPPPASGSDLKALKAMFPESTSRRVVFDMGMLDAVNRFEEAKAAMKTWKAQKAAAQVEIIQAIGTAEAAILPDGSGYTYKSGVRAYAAKPAREIPVRTLRKVKRL